MKINAKIAYHWDEFILFYYSVFCMTTVAAKSEEGYTEKFIFRQACTRKTIGPREALDASTDRKDSIATTLLDLPDL